MGMVIDATEHTPINDASWGVMFFSLELKVQGVRFKDVLAEIENKYVFINA